MAAMIIILAKTRILLTLMWTVSFLWKLSHESFITQNFQVYGMFIVFVVFPALQQSTSVDTKSKVDRNVNKQVDAIKV